MNEREYDLFILKIHHDDTSEAKWTTYDGKMQNNVPGAKVNDNRDLRDDIVNDIRALKLGQLEGRAEDIRRLGRNLYRAIFYKEIGNLFEQAIRNVLTERQSGNKKRCLRIIIDVDPKSAVFEWPLEFLYWDSQGGYWLATEKPWLALSRRTVFGGTVNLVRQNWPLRVLVVISKPKSLGGVMTGKVLEEIGKLVDLKSEEGGQESKKIDVKVLGRVEDYERRDGIDYLDKPATYGNIRQLISSEWQPQVVHFIGHGKLDGGVGCLALEVLDVKNKAGDAQWCNGELTSKLFTEPPQLILLQACESAASGTEPGFMSLAATLLQRNILAVVAMQFEIRNDDATTFATAFYEALRDGLDVDAAVQNGRWTICNNVQWNERFFGAPVLFMYEPFSIIQPLLPRSASLPTAQKYGATETVSGNKLRSTVEQAQYWIEKALSWLGDNEHVINEDQAKSCMSRACSRLSEAPKAEIVREAMQSLEEGDAESAKQMLKNVNRMRAMSTLIEPQPTLVSRTLQGEQERQLDTSRDQWTAKGSSLGSSPGLGDGK